MAKKKEPFNFQKIDNLKPRDKPWKYSGEEGSGNKGGLYVLVSPSGGKLWRMEYTNPKTGKRRTLSFGAFPVVSIVDALQARDNAKRLIAQGIDPRDAKREAEEQQRMQARANATTFRLVAGDWYAGRTAQAQATAKKYRGLLEKIIYPGIGDEPIAQVSTQAVALVIDRLKDAGKISTARMTLGLIRMVFDYAVDKGLCSVNPVLARRWRFGHVEAKHYPALVRATEIGEFLARADEYRAKHPGTRPATLFLLRMSPYLFLRPSELRELRWSEVDLDRGLLTIPGERMKTRRAHLVPLARQILEALRTWREEDPDAVFVFGNAIKGRVQPLSHRTLITVLEKMGYKGMMSPHGFRHLASTMLNEMGFRGDVIEMQLAHKETNATRGVYNRAEYMTERRDMMQRWADYLDSLREQALDDEQQQMEVEK